MAAATRGYIRETEKNKKGIPRRERSHGGLEAHRELEKAPLLFPCLTLIAARRGGFGHVIGHSAVHRIQLLYDEKENVSLLFIHEANTGGMELLNVTK